MATRHVLADLAGAAAEAGLGDVEIESVGGVDAEQRIAAGEAFDLVFLAAGALKRLADAGHVDAGTVTPLVVSQVAAAVASGDAEPAARPDSAAFDDADGVRTALRAATAIGYSTGPSGTALVEMIEGWGLAEELGDRLVQARPGVPVAASLAAGDVDLGFQQLSELVGQPGVRILGVLPADCAIETVFAGAVAARAAAPDAAARVLAQLASPEAEPIKAAHAFGAA
ncbi:substrate-binding domain-containing protein [Microbacterium halophytorum]|uniref:substrate-binding domain-containing protein n=1 Tax=Microbacterium halophytorum TaxID=2067568 RepID=UPI000CFA97BD|nr:substrate-binding domain-containing protein [Microbacterium halophytorum]